MRLRISRAAEQDLLDGGAFYEIQQPGIGAYFLDSLVADIDSLALYAGIPARPHGRFHRALAKRSGANARRPLAHSLGLT
ncbi:MAG: hypothetical protein WCV99_16325 [Sterolibacterium sp.]|jgi:hypothetical protein